MTIPSFLLAKLYVKGSLRNTGDGFELSLKNIIDSTSLSGIGPVTSGDKTYEDAGISITVKDKVWMASDLSTANTVPLAVGILARIAVKGEPLPAGTHRIQLETTSTDVGKLKIVINDAVQ